MQVKDQWALKALGVKTWSEAKTTRVQREGEPPEALSAARGLANVRERIRNWYNVARTNKWEEYQKALGRRELSQAQRGGLEGRVKQHRGLRKAESSAVIQLRSGKIGFNHFLYTRKVPGIEGPGCPCGASKQDGKHVLLFCPSYQEGRAAIIKEASTSDYQRLLSTTKGIRAAGKMARQIRCSTSIFTGERTIEGD